MDTLNIPVKTIADEATHTEYNNIVAKINELVDAISWEKNNKLSLNPKDGHLYLDYTIGQKANFSIENGHLILIQ